MCGYLCPPGEGWGEGKCGQVISCTFLVTQTNKGGIEAPPFWLSLLILSNSCHIAGTGLDKANTINIAIITRNILINNRGIGIAT